MTRPLSRDEARAVLAVALVWREHGHGPLWRELSQALGVSRDEGRRLILRLSRRGLLAFERDVARSLRATDRGVRLALRAARGARR